jgi:hypothetical protein
VSAAACRTLYRYTFSDTDFAVAADEAAPSDFDPRHRE